jgi:hypothetical protein
MRITTCFVIKIKPKLITNGKLSILHLGWKTQHGSSLSAIHVLFLFLIAFLIKQRFPHPFFTIIFHYVYNQPINPMGIIFWNMPTLVIDLRCTMQHTTLLHQSNERFIFTWYVNNYIILFSTHKFFHWCVDIFPSKVGLVDLTCVIFCSKQSFYKIM